MPTTPSDLTRLSFARLNAGGVLPAAPAMMVVRMNSDSLAFAPNVVESPELDPSGQLADSIYVGGASAGGIEFPLVRSAAFHEFLAAVFRNEWGAGMVSDEGPAGVFGARRALTPDELIPARSVFMYDFEKMYAAPGGNRYHLYRKNAIASMSLRIQPNEILSGTVTLAGGIMDPSDVQIDPAATYTDPGEYATFTSPNVTEVAISGINGIQCFNTMTLTFNSNVRGVPCVGEESDREKAIGRFLPTFDGTTYFVDNQHVEALRNQDFMSVAITLTDGSGNSYRFFYPRCKFVTAPVTTPGTNQDVMQPVSLRGHYSAEHGYSCMVTRTLAA